MARTPNQEQQPHENSPIDPLIESNLNTMSLAISQYSEGRDSINKEIAHIQYAEMNEYFSRTVRISKIAKIKQNKDYRNIAGMKNPHSAEILKGTWEDFCLLMKRSVDQVDRDIANFNAFGEEALEAMQNVGIGYRELTQLRKLPEDEKTALIEVAEAGDKVALLDLAEELIAKQTKEKEALNKQLQDTKLDLESSRKLLNTKNSKIDELSAQLEKKALIEPPSVDEQIKQLRHEVNMIAFEAESIIRGKLRVGFEKINSEYGSTEREVMAGWIGNIRSALNQLAGEFDLPEIDDEFAWAKED